MKNPDLYEAYLIEEREKSKLRRQNNKEKMNAQSRARYQKNKEYILEQRKKRASALSPAEKLKKEIELREYNKDYRQRNGRLIREQQNRKYAEMTEEQKEKRNQREREKYREKKNQEALITLLKTGNKLIKKLKEDE